MVGMIEPRKGYAQALEAFELLLAAGSGCQSCFSRQAGLVSWKNWLQSPCAHSELNKRLFGFLKGINDEFLEQVYSASTCLIAASYGEGFGLPLIEAAQHQNPDYCPRYSCFPRGCW